MRDKEMAGEIGLFPDWSQAIQITFCAIDAERVVGKLFDNQPALLRTIKRDRNVASRLDSENVRGRGTS
jgi:hypothetical protein